jgi:mannan endo-1,4-beta-mannosidase
MWRQRDTTRFVVGANLPWIGYGTDVGASAWFPDGGLSARADAMQRLDRALAALADDGIHVARTFLLCDARSGVRTDGEGCPAGIDAAVLPDVEALLGAADRRGVRLVPVLVDFHLCKPARIIDGVQLGGRSSWIADADARAAFAERVIQPIAAAFGAHPAVAAWDVMNEPEWCLGGGPVPRRSLVTAEALGSFLQQLVQCIGVNAAQPVTVGCAGTWRLDLVRPLGLDFYQVHWYERFGWRALTRPVSELGLDDRPIVLGEFSGRAPVADVLDAAAGAGYEGAFVWSVLAEDVASTYPPAIAEWVRAHAPDDRRAG